MIYIVILFVIAYFIDMKIRRNLFSQTIEEIGDSYEEILNARLEEIDEEFTEKLEGMNQNVNYFLTMNGISGNFNMPDPFNPYKWKVSGKPIIVTRGRVIDKFKVDAEKVIDNIVQAKRAGEQNIPVISEDVADHCYIRLFSEHDGKEYFFEDPLAYEHITPGDLVFMSVYYGKVQTMSYETKENK